MRQNESMTSYTAWDLSLDNGWSSQPTTSSTIARPTPIIDQVATLEVG